jgi:hypothetical protein
MCDVVDYGITHGGTISGDLAVTGNETVSGTLGVTGAAATGALTVTGNETVSGTLGVTGAAATGALTVTGNETVSGSLTVAGYELPEGVAGPADHGLVSWTHDPYFAASSAIAVNGTVYVVKLPIRRAVTVDTILWAIGTAGLTPTAGQNEVGLYSSAGTRLAATNVDADISSSGSKSTAIAAQALTAGSFVWVAFVFNAATGPTLLRGSSFETSPNINTTAATRRAAVAATAQTVLPASFTPSALSTNNCLTYFAALSV